MDEERGGGEGTEVGGDDLQEREGAVHDGYTCCSVNSNRGGEVTWYEGATKGSANLKEP